MYQHIIQQLCAVYPRGEATAITRLLMEEMFGLSYTDLLLGKDKDLSANDRTRVDNNVRRLLKNEPIQYVLGETSFCGLRLHVEPGVLIPRPETEELVEWITQSMPPQTKTNTATNDEADSSPIRVLDIGTGSGCIALALAARGYQVEAWDISSRALEIAQGNAQQLGLNVRFRQVDALHIPPTDERYHIIVSNPPYICQHEESQMERNVLDYEPHEALFVPNDDHLLFYRAITRFAVQHLMSNGMLFFEINRAYGKETSEMIEQEGLCEISLQRDAFDNNRMISAKYIP